MHVTILGKRYRFQFTRRLPKEDDGDCDAPTKRSKTIRIREGLSEAETLDTILHECLHAADWNQDEEWVRKTAHDVAKILTRLGYRRSLDDKAT